MEIPHYDDLKKNINRRNVDIRKVLTDFYSKELEKGFTNLESAVNFPLHIDVNHHIEDSQGIGNAIIQELLRSNGYKNARIQKSSTGLKITIHENGMALPRTAPSAMPTRN